MSDTWTIVAIAAFVAAFVGAGLLVAIYARARHKKKRWQAWHAYHRSYGAARGWSLESAGGYPRIAGTLKGLAFTLDAVERKSIRIVSVTVFKVRARRQPATSALGFQSATGDVATRIASARTGDPGFDELFGVMPHPQGSPDAALRVLNAKCRSHLVALARRGWDVVVGMFPWGMDENRLELRLSKYRGDWLPEPTDLETGVLALEAASDAYRSYNTA